MLMGLKLAMLHCRSPTSKDGICIPSSPPLEATSPVIKLGPIAGQHAAGSTWDDPVDFRIPAIQAPGEGVLAVISPIPLCHPQDHLGAASVSFCTSSSSDATFKVFDSPVYEASQQPLTARQSCPSESSDSASQEVMSAPAEQSPIIGLVLPDNIFRAAPAVKDAQRLRQEGVQLHIQAASKTGASPGGMLTDPLQGPHGCGIACMPCTRAACSLKFQLEAKQMPLLGPSCYQLHCKYACGLHMQSIV